MTQSKSKSNHVLVGLGGTGGKILKAFKMRLFEEFPTPEQRQELPVQILYVDSTDEMMPKNGEARPDFQVMGQNASFTNNEFLNIKSVDITYILDHVDNYPSISGIVENAERVKLAIGALGQAAGQMRRAGRLLFAVNAQAYINALNAAFARCFNASHDESKKYIHIFAGLSGGTGSGSIVDTIVQSRKAYPDATILVYAMIPEMHLPKGGMDQGRYYPNGYAAVCELNALQTGRFKPQDVTGIGKIDLFNPQIKGVADGITLYSNVNDKGLAVNSLTELPTILSDYVFTRIFYIDEGNDEKYGDMIRAYNFENMDQFAIEFDEGEEADEYGKFPAARTKKVSSVGIKRVIYPELRILQHITYSLGEKVLYQFKYNNWRENEGFVNMERNMDYRNAYMDDKHLQKWMLDLAHLTLEKKILPSDKNYQTFNDFWHDKALAYGDQAQEDSCPLQALDNIMSDIYVGQFRNNEGVVTYYENKERAIPDMVNEMRHNIEADLFNQWKEGNISVVELVKISKLLVERVAELRIQLENDIISEEDEYKGVDKERQENVEEWKKMGIIRQKMLGKGSKLFAFHQDTLTEYYERKTRLVALEFAKKLASRLAVEIGKMDADILTFSQRISTAIDETERLVNAQKKVNKGIEDMSGAIIEVSEEDAIAGFEKDMAINKTDMPGIANSFREAILPKHDFTNFGHLASEIDFDTIKEAFDRTLSVKVVEIHSSLPTSAKKVLGMNVLTELQQALTSDEEINKFAYELVRQSGVFLKLDDNQMKLHLRNNEGPLSPTTNPASVNKMAVIVSIPSVERESDSMKRFQKKIIDAINQQFGNSAAQGAKPMINDESPRSDELSITSIQYCYPMRAASWLKQYKERYDRFLNTGNPSVDAQNAILLHSEGDGSELPNFFALTKDEINAKIAKRQQQQPQQPIAAQQPQQPAAPQQPAMPPRQPEMPPMPGVVLPPPPQEKPLQLFMSVAGQQYGPYDLEICKQLVANKQLTPQTMVWKEGLPAWVPAAQVADLQPLFMPPSMPGMPPMPPMPGGMPTPPPVM